MGESVIEYEKNGKKLKIYISKDYENTSINFRVDDEKVNSVMVIANNIWVPVFKYTDPDGKDYYQSEF